MLNVDIDSIIPHREPIKMLTEVLEARASSGVAAAVVSSTWPLFEDGAVNSLVLIEAVAQTAAVVEGYKRQKQGKNAVKGWMVGIKSAHFFVSSITVNTRLIISVTSKYTLDNYAVMEGEIKSGEDVLATVVLQALRLNEEDIQK
ncbi:MAG TPA: hypothetical protein ENN23_00765 [Deltaproteobacteria bacterium]|nr:hypothetical protein [Deltaproteobacteria bacterium]